MNGLLDKVVSVAETMLGWIGHVEDIFTMLMILIGCLITGIVLGYLGQVSFGWRGRLYGAIMGGMIINLVAKFHEASYLGAFAIMLAVTLLAFFIGQGTGLKIFSGMRKGSSGKSV